MTVVLESLALAEGNGTSITKTVRVIRALASLDGERLGVTQIAAAAHLPKSTTHRVLAELVKEELVSRFGCSYRLGKGWFSLQSALVRSDWVRLVDRAMTPMARLFEDTHATINLGVVVEDRVLYLEKLTGPGGTLMMTRVGSRMPLSCTALGKALLAFSSPSLTHQICRAGLPVLTQFSIVTPRVLFSQLEQVRASGMAVDHEESRMGVHCVATPIFDAESAQCVAALSLMRTGTGCVSKRDAAALKEAAGEVRLWLKD